MKNRFQKGLTAFFYPGSDGFDGFDNSDGFDGFDNSDGFNGFDNSGGFNALDGFNGLNGFDSAPAAFPLPQASGTLTAPESRESTGRSDLPWLPDEHSREKFSEEQLAEQLAALEERCFSTPWSVRSFRSALRIPQNRFLLVFHSEKLVGYGVLFTLFEEAELLNIAVAPEQRGRGIGEAMLKALIAQAQKRGGEILRLEVRESNLPAIRMYEKAGFVPEGRRKNYYKMPLEDAILMQKALR